MWYVLIAAIIALQLFIFAGYRLWIRRRVHRAHDRSAPAWLEVAERFSLTVEPRQRSRDVIHIHGEIDGFRVALWGFLIVGRRVGPWAGLWTHITLQVPDLSLGLRPRSPTVLWFRREADNFEIGTPGFAAYVQLIPPESEAIAVEGGHPAMLFFGDPERAAELLADEGEYITSCVVGRSMYVHDDRLQLNHRSITEDPKRLVEDIESLVKLARIITRS